MQSIFPYLLNWSQIIPFILRVVGGSYFLYFGYIGLTSAWQDKLRFFAHIHLKPEKLYTYAFVLSEFVGGIMLIMGLFTQVVALVFLIISLTTLVIKRAQHVGAEHTQDTYILLSGIMLCLIIGGAGYFGMDLMI